jgi:ADP-ribose pyrophosphatase YjhB (NUDIX family)
MPDGARSARPERSPAAAGPTQVTHATDDPPRRDRVAARVLLVDADGAVLLMKGSDPHRPEAGTWWFTPGGGVDDGESVEDAARREVHEETGFVVEDLGTVVFERVVEFDFEGERYRQLEYFFAVRVERFDAVTDGWTEIERRAVHEHRWWTPEEIAASAEIFYPEQLVERLRRVRAS